MKKILIAILAIVVIVGFFIISCPDKNAHVSALKQVVMENKTEAPKDKWEALGNALASSLAENLIDHSVYVKNYFIFSKGVYEGKTVSIGLLGHVFTGKELSFSTKEHDKSVEVAKVENKPKETVFYYSDGSVMATYGEKIDNSTQVVYESICRDMLAKEPQSNQFYSAAEYKSKTERWKNDPIYGWFEKNPSADGSKYDFYNYPGGLIIYTTINPRMQSYAENAVIEQLSVIQEAFEKECAYRENAPYSKDIDISTINMDINSSRKWSNRMRDLKNQGISQEDIDASFNRPTKMKIYSWKNGEIVDTVMTPNDSILYYKSLVRGTLIAMNPLTGTVEAYVGNEYGQKYDFAQRSRRTVGTAIYPFIFAEALESGLTPCSTVKNAPQYFEVGGRTWSPRSTDPESVIGSDVTLKWGLTHSSTNITAYLVKKASPETEKACLSRFNIDIDDVTPSICVGAVEASLYDLTSGFNVFANQGQYVQPVFVTKITDYDGNVLYRNESVSEFTISEQNAYYMVDMLKAAADNGTASRLRYKYGFEGEVACKTGSTIDLADSWFLGSVPNLTVGVWTGWESRWIHFSSSTFAQSSFTTLPIWANFVKKCQEDSKVEVSKLDTFKVPKGVVSVPCTGGDEDIH